LAERNPPRKPSVGVSTRNSEDCSIGEVTIIGSGVAVETINSKNIHVGRVTIIENLVRELAHDSKFPDLSKEQKDDLVLLASSVDKPTFTKRVAQSRVGKWLADQKFTEWARLADAVYKSFD